jgi:hypothetical protein
VQARIEKRRAQKLANAGCKLAAQVALAKVTPEARPSFFENRTDQPAVLLVQVLALKAHFSRQCRSRRLRSLTESDSEGEETVDYSCPDGGLLASRLLLGR